jgi:MYXO-CTERM domain-containing protein
MNASNRFKFTAGFAALASIATVVAPATPAHAAGFSAGSLVVERIGTGTAALSSAATQISILEVTTAGSLTQTIILPSGTSDPQTDSGSATSDGYLNTYGGFVSVPGYNAALGTASVASLNAKVNSLLDSTGSVAMRTLFPVGGPSGTTPGTPAGVSPFSGNNYRSSIATSGSTFYGVGTASGTPNTGGVWYFDGSAFTQVSSTAATVSVTNLRTVEIYNNQLYFASSSGTFLGVSSLGTGLPTSGPELPTLQINAGAGASTYGFVMFSTGSQGAGVLDLAYLADDRTGAGGGIQKYSYNGTSWSNSWSLLVGASGTSTLQSGTGVGFAGIRGLAGTYDSILGATLYATTTESNNNRLISIFDTGTTTPSTYTTLQSSGSNFAFRGVDFSPVAVPEPSTFAIAALATLGMAGLIRRRRRAVNLDG